MTVGLALLLASTLRQPVLLGGGAQALPLHMAGTITGAQAPPSPRACKRTGCAHLLLAMTNKTTAVSRVLRPGQHLPETGSLHVRLRQLSQGSSARKECLADPMQE